MTGHRFPNLVEEYNTVSSVIDKRSLESLFDGPKKLEDIYFDYITEIEREAYKQGFADGEISIRDKINNDIRRRIEIYIGKVVKISNYVAKVAPEVINKTEDKPLKVIDARARFAFEKNKIQVLVLIEAPFDKEIAFLKLCSNIEKLIRESEQEYLVSISCVNTASGDTDYSLIKSDYPFLIKISN